MAIRVKCGQCGKTLSAPDSADGRKGKCPNCGNVVTLKAAAPAAETAPFELDDAFSSQLDESTPSTPPVEERTVHGSRRVEPSPAVRGGGAAFGGRGARAGVEEPALGRSFASPMSGGTGYSRRYLYWLLALLFIPLAMSLLGGESDLEDRLSRSLAQHSDAIEKLPETAGEEEFFAVFPDHRIEGALLSRDTKMHWLFAALATAGFFAAAYFLLEQGGARLTSYFSIGMFTATVGIIALIAFQYIADWTQGFWMRGRGIVTILFYVVKFIGFSYRCALDPETGVALSAIGFTCGVGLCEEFIKALPVVWRANSPKALDWRAACVLGFISGVGFGVAEGIMYSGDYYNGLAGGDMYVVRFLSCVALHAIWGAAVGIAIVRKLEHQTPGDFGGWVMLTLSAMIVPMILHGLYDTFLKKDMNGLALAVALVSLGWLAFMIERSTRDQPEYVPAVD